MRHGQGGAYRRTALFVDFENVFIGLRNSSPDAAMSFATDPARWARWMEQDLGPFLVDDDDLPRVLLRRICYLDPGRSSRYRSYFTRAGFRVVDCPALTGMGKNSADIHMVLDIVDTLAHPTRFDEFIVLSADADFTPVLLRLREHDRRTAMLVIGPTAAALQAACDFAIPDIMFIEEALGHDGSAGATPKPVITTPPAQRPATVNATAQAAAPAPDVRARIEAALRELVAASASPIDLASAAHHVRRVVGRVAMDGGWAGAGGFKQFVQSIQDQSLVLDPVHPGWLRDPRRHEPVAGESVVPAGAPEIAERVHRVVGVPLLSPEAYRVLFASITGEGRSAADGSQSQAELAIRDACGHRGQPISRTAIHFVLLGLHYSGVAWSDPVRDADNLATEFAGNVLRLAANARMDLNDDERDQIRAWISGPAGVDGAA